VSVRRREGSAVAFTEIVEDAIGRTVHQFFSQVAYDPDMAVEMLVLAPAS
jgi:hypothetical protein